MNSALRTVVVAPDLSLPTDNSHYLHLRRAVIDFLYTRQAQLEKLVA